jgi:integrase
MSTARTLADSPLDLLFERYRTRLMNRGRKPQTIYNFVRAAVPFQRWLEERGVAPADATEDEVDAYFSPSRFPQSPGTRRMHSVQIRAAYRYAHRRGWVKADPTVDFELPPEPDPTPTVLSSAELRTIRDRCRNWKHETLWGLLVYTGMRRDELRRAAWEDVDLDALTLSVVGKGGKPRTVPIHPALAEILERASDANAHTQGEKTGAVLWTETGRTFYSGVQSFERALQPIAPEHGFHVFRRTVATSLARNGVRPDVIDRIMGWQPRSIRDRYYVVTQLDDLHRAILKLYLDDPI